MKVIKIPRLYSKHQKQAKQDIESKWLMHEWKNKKQDKWLELLSKKNQWKKGLWSEKKQSTDNIKTQEDPTRLTTHPTTSHNIKLNQKGGCTRLFKEQLRMYVTFGQKATCIRGFWPKTCMYMRILAKNMHVYMTFGQKLAYVCDS